MTKQNRGPILSAKIAIARAIIDANYIGVAFSDHDRKAMSDLSQTELRSIIKTDNPSYPSDKRHLHVLAYDWMEPCEWSWRTAIQIAHSRDPEEAKAVRERQRYQYALRAAIQEDMQDFRGSQHDPLCARCGSTEALSTDHVAPPFTIIAGYFLSLYPQIALKRVPGAGDWIADPQIEAAWIGFHAQHAVYQILCRRCNSAKGAR